MIKGPLRQGEENSTVADLCCGQNWKWELTSFDLPQPIKERIKAVPIQLNGSGIDTVLWKFSKNGEFTVSSAYRLANQREEPAIPFHGQWIWKLDTLPRITCFLWLCLHGSVPVKEVLAERGINCDKVCPLCRV
ncbi:putative ribonuclease h protein [Quercus suber]|uniref:Ribonuclease h protein n=1 Tax=Quercus suber TaxID=58331 RepID=A0AAW0JUS0_QUESU